MAVTKRSYMDVLLGLFVAGGLALLVTFIFLLGQERRLFDTSSFIRAQFPNVAGLLVGADVLLGGVVVGHVSEIRFPPMTTKDFNVARQVTVIIRVSHSMMPWIRQDSIARIDSKGLLGDKNINISLGSPAFPQVKEGALLQSVAPIDFNEGLAKAQMVLENVTETVVGARKLMEGFVAKGGDTALAQAAESLKNVALEIERGDGIIHKLVYDKKSGSDFQASLGGLKKTIDSVRLTAGHVDRILSELETGKGLLHTLIYDPQGESVVGSADRILKEIEKVATEIRTGTGILHSLIYVEDNGRMIENLNSVSSDLQKIVSKVRGGEGTIGRLLADPTVYEDLKSILSEVKRNEVLKALIRFGITKGEKEPEIKEESK